MTTAAAPLAACLPHDQSAALGRHLQQCEQARGPWFVAAQVAERLHALVAPRFATTVALLALGLALASGWW
ncbi:MAG TPA: hypothetical protein VLA61_16485 [Ideonella sp.]|uniref:hypothetical protein n=1 Tax=Ideonella sp. TaxID=1929293 RepID=UPI002C724598|nr:hypothetical protein [Ideonella sp.]HSI49871.1 hypothetical protein [Ideonella sp.]